MPSSKRLLVLAGAAVAGADEPPPGVRAPTELARGLTTVFAGSADT